MRLDLASFMTVARFDKLRRSYAKRWNAGLSLVDASGMPALRGGKTTTAERQIMKKLLSESLRWGEAPVEMLLDGSIVWLVPLLLNTSLVGGVAATIDQRLLFPNDDGIPAFDVRDAARDLL